MDTPRILPDDSPGIPSMPSMPTLRGGASSPSEPPRIEAGPNSLGSMKTVRGRTTPRGERLRAGDVLLGRYTVLDELGEGGMGVVYKCLDNVGGIEVALKCLPPELSRNEAEMEGIRDNYAIVARLHHSAISGLRQLEKDPDFDEYYLVMDLAEGEDLSTILRRRHGEPMTLPVALAILRPIASALDYAHAAKVLHRDVKPANVKVAFKGGASSPSEPKVQLLDFGLAAEVRSSMSRVSQRGHVGSSGTPAYMAPEQWEARTQSPATDQYALGVMAYQMLAGHLPFDADDTDLLRRAVLSRDPDPVPGLPRAVNAVLLRALAKDPAARYPSCGAFVDALGRLARSARPTLGRRIWPWVAALGLLAAGTLVVTEKYGKNGEGGASSPSEPPRGDVSHAESAEVVATAPSPSEPRAESAKPGGASSPSEPPAVAPQRNPGTQESRDSDLAGEPSPAARPEVSPHQVLHESVAKRTADAHAEAEMGRRKAEMERHQAEAFREEHLAFEEEAKRKRAEAARPESSPHRAGERKVIRVGSQEIALRWCPPGTFMMGSPASEYGRYDNETQHSVTLSKGFWMGETEVTQGLWKEVMGGNPSFFNSGDNYPVESILWSDCQEFLAALNRKSPVSGFRWTLPTEAQWEYACRAGSTTAYFWGNALNGDRANCDGNYPCGTTQKGPDKQKTTPVGSYTANAWGLHDMHGNVWEWCSDWGGTYPTGAVRDPAGPSTGSYRVLRGGSWLDDARNCRSACRFSYGPGLRFIYLGFRVALAPVQ